MKRGIIYYRRLEEYNKDIFDLFRIKLYETGLNRANYFLYQMEFKDFSDFAQTAFDWKYDEDSFSYWNKVSNLNIFENV